MIALIAASATLGSSIGAAGFNYLFTERQRTKLTSDSVEIQKMGQLVAQAAQKTAEQTAQINAARLDFERQVQLLNAAREDLRVQVARVSGMNDTRRTDNDEVRLRSTLAQQENDLMPQVQASCPMSIPTPTRVLINCKFRNQGNHRVVITNQSRALVNQVTGLPVEGLIGEIAGDQVNSVLQKGENNLNYWVELKVPKERLVGSEFRFQFKADTDPAVVRQVKEFGGKYVTEQQLTNRATMKIVVRETISD
ncbi:hypothetical protein LJR170_001799 [Variovorax paradoxus]